MYTHRKHKAKDRIVSISSQPHIRPIARGKATAATEFFAKVATSIVAGFAHVVTLSWDDFNEGKTLIKSIMRYLQKHGCYTEAVQADKIYRNRGNL